MAGRRIAVGIGVGKVRGMPRLDGARADAQRFLDWAARNHETKSFIDADGEAVSSVEIRSFLRTLVESGDEIDRLILYFSGHGASLPMGEFWLLSDFGADGDECINVELSRRTAREHPLGRVALIADACRSSVSPAKFSNGRNLFPSRPEGQAIPRLPKMDLFFATRLGADAQEVAAGDPTKAYGVFSRCLFSALEGKETSAIDAERDPRVVSSQKLADWLEETVPLETGKIPGGIVQPVDVTSGWGRPDDWYVQLTPGQSESVSVDGGVLGSEAVIIAESKPSLDIFVPLIVRLKGWMGLQGLVLSSGQSAARVEEAQAQQRKAAQARQAEIVDAAGRKSFETRQGITLVGATIRRAIASPAIKPMDIFPENGAWHIRCRNGIQSLAIELDDGRWIGAVSLPEFVATIVVGNRGVTSLNYGLSRNSPRIHEIEAPEAIYTDAVARWSALESLGAPVRSAELLDFARKVRMGKHANPTLGILAAYAYDRRGDTGPQSEFDSVDSIACFFADVDHYVPFDIAFLSSARLGAPRERVEFRSGIWTARGRVAGGFPLMTRGWALIQDDDVPAAPALRRLRTGLLPGLWTSFEPHAGAVFADLIQEGRL